jgi:hypothetical protein
MPGGCAREGPMNASGEARTENMGSVNTFNPLACTNMLA